MIVGRLRLSEARAARVRHTDGQDCSGRWAVLSLVGGWAESRPSAIDQKSEGAHDIRCKSWLDQTSGGVPPIRSAAVRHAEAKGKAAASIILN